MARYLLTGGAGFIGAAIAERLVDRGDAVVIVDNLSTGTRDNVPDRARLMMADVGDERFWTAFDNEGIDAILHLGAQSSGEISHADPLADFDTNARGTFLVLRWAERYGIKRFLFASSMAVYGSADAPIAEDRQLAPSSFYGASKAAAEAAVSFFGRQGGATTIFRMFNVYGPGQNIANLRQGMASIYLAYLLAGEPIVVKGSLDRYRDLIFIDDVVDAWVQAIDRPAARGATYNLGTGRRTTVRDLLDALLRAAGQTPGTYPIVVEAPTAGDLFGSVADIERITRDLGWQPRIALDEGLRRMVAWASLLAGR